MFAPIAKSVLGSPLDKLLIIAVLTSASASTQTTILPPPRDIAVDGAPRRVRRQFGNVHPAIPDAGFSTIWMGAVVIRLVFILLSSHEPRT